MDQTVNSQAINQQKMALARGVEPVNPAKKSPFIRGFELVPAPRIERGTY